MNASLALQFARFIGAAYQTLKNANLFYVFDGFDEEDLAEALESSGLPDEFFEDGILISARVHEYTPINGKVFDFEVIGTGATKEEAMLNSLVGAG